MQAPGIFLVQNQCVPTRSSPLASIEGSVGWFRGRIFKDVQVSGSLDTKQLPPRICQSVVWASKERCTSSGVACSGAPITAEFIYVGGRFRLFRVLGVHYEFSY